MNAFGLKQPVLKPQDLVVVLKLAGMQNAEQTFAALARDLLMSASEVHAAVQRCVASHLLDRSDGTFGVNRVSLREFLLHGVRYAFPIAAGPVMRGMPTGVSAPPLDAFFEHADLLPVVWPDPEGAVRGIAICPLYPSVPGACKLDPILYRLLALVDALRGGAARERELAEQLLIDSIQ